MTTVNPLQTLVYVLHRRFSAAPSDFTVSESYAVSAKSEVRHD